MINIDPMDIGNNRYFGKYVGSFDRDWNNNHHRHHNIIVAGDVYFVNKHTLFLYNFSFDGQESGRIYFIFFYTSLFKKKITNSNRSTHVNSFLSVCVCFRAVL